MFYFKICRKSAILFRLSAVLEDVNTLSRKASSYKRTQLSVPHSDHLQSFKTELFQQRSELKACEWEDLRNNLISKYKHININNVDAIILGLCGGADQLSLAKNYVRYLRGCGLEPNMATIGRLLRIYNAAYHTRGGNDTALTADEQQYILDIYSQLRERYEILDATTCENLIYGLVCTNDWRAGVELLRMTRQTATPSTAAYTELTIKAFTKGDLETGWHLLEETVMQRKEPKCESYLAYLHHIAKVQANFENNFEKLLWFLEKHELIITAKVAQYVTENINPKELTAKCSQIDKKGKCGICSLRMRNIAISDAEYAKLSNSFLNKVLIRNDIFQKSTPEEVESFKRFVTQTAPYDCVIDGLNVAYSMGAKKPPKVLASLLANVVKHFKNQRKHVLVLGRKHMNSWPKDAMLYIRKNASLFLTNNLSHDDPFLLYATLKSGQTTDFFSRDLMRSHAFLLGSELRTIFRRWQLEHQYALITQIENGKIIVKEPTRHVLCAHQVQDTWHVPYKQSYSPNPAEIFEVPESWLCIKFNKH
ncbi:mitochondrial ribonuclease P catalytic subunit isoform X1 [Rhagoletis pomonella]|uniref:mitochondrial ribonuclease P catalytic subunit isoform X1 n=1 Tax=Rhagoletis pomonella TaxID=28610 RepID=UPI00177AE272|nr:mitochondrial ribonuclease P catalytic subunit isoform X1 [Rhagoletis pomonella]